MANYIIDNTSGTLQILIQPQRKDGPGQSRQNSDLEFYGLGSLRWGEGVDRNLLKLLENFACPQKNYIAGDSQPPGTPDKIWPKGPDDAAIANKFDPNIDNVGVTHPNDGQMWFNTTNGQTYVYSGDWDSGDGAWKSISGAVRGTTAPGISESTTGDLWYNTAQDFICLQNQMMVFDPTHCEAPVDGWISIAQNYIPRCGSSTVCAELTFDDSFCPGGPSCQGKIIGAILENCTYIDASVPGDPAFPEFPATRETVYKYAFPEGTRLVFPQACAPYGWNTDDATGIHGRYIQIVSQTGLSPGEGGDTGGSYDPWEMSGSQVPTHGHTGDSDSKGSHNHSATSGSAGYHNHTGNTAYTGNHRHTGSTGGGGSHGHSGYTNSAGSHTHIMYSIPHEEVSGYGTGTLREGWRNHTSRNTGTAGSHTHSVTIYAVGNHTHSLSMSTTGNHRHSFTTAAVSGHIHTISVNYDGAHTHSITVYNNSGPPSWTPKYYNAIVAVKQEDDDVFSSRSGGVGNSIGTYC